jgi:hypothetical protein
MSALQDSYSTQCHRKAKKIIKDINHPRTPFPVHPTIIQKARSEQVHQSWNERLKNTFYVKAIRVLNSHY